MSMTKKEQAALAALSTEVRLAKALRWSNAEAPLQISKPPRAPYVNGWTFNGYGAGTVSPACTDGHIFWNDKHRTDDGANWKDRPQGGSQTSGPLYPTRLAALIALRIAKERQCAETLAKIDEAVEKERG